MFAAFTHLWHRGNNLENTIAREALRGVRGAGIPILREALPRFGLELRRARRYERALSAVALEPGERPSLTAGTTRNGNGAGPSMHPDPVSSYLTFFVFGSLLREALRETDLLAYSPDRHMFAALLPETGEAEARRCVHRISQRVSERMEIGVRAGIAEFPRHGLTLDDLFSNARREWEGHRWMGKLTMLKELSNA